MQKEARPAWEEVPVSFKKQIEETLGDKIIAAVIAWGGYSNTACFDLQLQSGRRIFAKGSHPGQDAHGTKTVQQEIYAYQNIPHMNEVAPHFISHIDDGDEDGWSLIFFEHKKNKKDNVWHRELISKAFAQLKIIHSIKAEELPQGFPQAWSMNYVERYFKPEGGWLRIKEEQKIYKKLLSIFSDEKYAENFFKIALPIFCESQKEFCTMEAREGVIHQDLRIDNFLVDEKENVYLIDFPNTCFGAVELDLAMILPSLAQESQMNIGELLDLYIEVTGIYIKKSNYIKALTCFSGHIADSAYRVVPEKLPRLRQMQKALLQQSLFYLASELALPSAPIIKNL